MRLDRIVVGVDGSDNSLAAVGWTAALAAALGSEVVAVHALGLLEQMEPAHPASDPPASSASPSRQIRERFEPRTGTRPLDAAGVVSRRLVATATPSRCCWRLPRRSRPT